jgi:DNA-directed RNA polymerase specialized sigma24 family protein
MLVANRDRAEDVAVAVFLRARRARDKLRDDQNVISWLLAASQEQAGYTSQP